jgi:hypothetical protein
MHSPWWVPTGREARSVLVLGVWSLNDAIVGRHTRSWDGSGTGRDRPDYERACARLEERRGIEGCTIEIAQGNGLVWEMDGGGTAAVFRGARDYVVVVRIWAEDPDDRGPFRTLAEAPSVQRIRIGELPISSGVLAVLWAPEDGRAFESLDSMGLPMGEMSMSGTGLTLEVLPGTYECFHDLVANAAGEARRCHLVRQTTRDE